MRAICLLLFFMHSSFAETSFKECRKNQNFVLKTLSTLNLIHDKCLETYYEELSKTNAKKVEQFNFEIDKIDSRLKEIAYSMNYMEVLCQAPIGERVDLDRSKECSQLVDKKNELIDNLSKLSLIDSPTQKNTSKNKVVVDQEVCPSSEQIEYYRNDGRWWSKIE